MRSLVLAPLLFWAGAMLHLELPLTAAEPPSERGLQVHAYTLRHQPAREALALVRPLLSWQGTVEEQPGGNTLVLRDNGQALARIIPVLQSFDRPPQNLRLDIQVVRARRGGELTPSPDAAGAVVPAELIERLRGLLRYDDYQVLATAGVSSKEGEDVTYSLGDGYRVSFRLGTVLAEQRLKLEGFRILEKVENSTNKGRQLEPRELFHATLNLWMGRPFTLVLAQDDARQEALMVAISCRREGEP